MGRRGRLDNQELLDQLEDVDFLEMMDPKETQYDTHTHTDTDSKVTLTHHRFSICRLFKTSLKHISCEIHLGNRFLCFYALQLLFILYIPGQLLHCAPFALSSPISSSLIFSCLSLTPGPCWFPW